MKTVETFIYVNTNIEDDIYLENEENYEEYFDYIDNLIDKNFKEKELYFPYCIEGLGNVKIKFTLENNFAYYDEDIMLLTATFTIDNEYDDDYVWKIVNSNNELHNFIVDKMNELVDNFNNTVNIKIPKGYVVFYKNNFYERINLNDNKIYTSTYNLKIKKDKITTVYIKDNMDMD